MTHELLNRFKIHFEQEQQKLSLSRVAANAEFHLSKDDMLDDVDMTSVELETGMRIRLRNREALLGKKIQEALRKIQDGTFGECETCGEEIELKRLEARPITTMCVSCKEEAERLESLHIDGRKHKSLGRKIRFVG
ncbi:TraR/DksA family transcriptional regulator [bacterium]|jgi:DnaK suppressor protein|nr:TraR/DksA family transcriptional regulator [bacterium]